MNFGSHPLCQLVQTFSIHSTEYQNAARMATELDGCFATLSTMHPGDPSAITSLRDCSQKMVSIDQSFGCLHGWTRAQHGKIFSEACRLLGKQQTDFTRPNWQEL